MLSRVLPVLFVMLTSFAAWTRCLLRRHLPHRAFDVGIGNSNGALALCVDGAVAIGASAKAG